jgi:hypothetical protein
VAEMAPLEYIGTNVSNTITLFVFAGILLVPAVYVAVFSTLPK